MSKQGGDDLEDDFVFDDTVALSGDEDAEPTAHLEDEDIFLDPADEEDDDDEPDVPAGNSADASAAKKRKRREKEKERKAKKLKLIETVEPVQLAAQSPLDLSAYLASMQAKTFPKLSALELEDLRIPASSIADTTAWTGPRTADHLVDFIVKVLPNLRLRLSQKSKSNGAPTLLYLAAAALRVVDITRVLKNKQLQGDKGAEVAKLFAKHFKLEEHVEYLKRTKIGSGVGTPGRVGKLLNDTDALNVSALSHIILDISHRDAKTFNILDIRETRDEVFKLVFKNEAILKGIKDGKIQVVLF